MQETEGGGCSSSFVVPEGITKWVEYFVVGKELDCYLVNLLNIVVLSGWGR